MTREQYEAYLFRQACGKAQSPEPKPTICHEPLAKEEGKAGDSSRVLVSIKSFRRRLLDWDNLCPKYFLDCCRYAGLIHDDNPAEIELQISQEKSNEEYTEITITK